MTRPTKAMIHMKTADAVDAFARLGLTLNEIAHATGLDKQMLYRDYRKEFQTGQADLIQRLRGAQIDKALKEKNTTMLIHLGKCYLGQSDFKNEEAAKEKSALDDVDTKDLLTLVQSEGNNVPKVIQDAVDGEEEKDTND